MTEEARKLCPTCTHSRSFMHEGQVHLGCSLGKWVKPNIDPPNATVCKPRQRGRVVVGYEREPGSEG